MAKATVKEGEGILIECECKRTHLIKDEGETFRVVTDETEWKKAEDERNRSTQTQEEPFESVITRATKGRSKPATS